MFITTAQHARIEELTTTYLRMIRSHLGDLDCLTHYFRMAMRSGLADELIGLMPSEVAAIAQQAA